MVKHYTLLFLALHFFCFADPLPSWNEGPAKNAILKFVEESVQNIPLEDRIATFDQDGTLWVEKPYYTQLAFALDVAKVPKTNLTAKEIETVLVKSHAGMTVEAYQNSVKQWLKDSLHPRFKKPYTDLVYQPMLEVLHLLQQNGFKTYIVSGGGQEFIRSYAEPVYHIPSEQIIGSTAKVKYEYREGHPVLIKEKELLFIDDKGGKPEAINLFIGKRPVAAFGNSDGDREMLEWSESYPGKSLQILIHHDDANREYAYDTDSKVGTFSTSLMEEAKKQGWIIVSMQRDWNTLFPLMQ